MAFCLVLEKNARCEWVQYLSPGGLCPPVVPTQPGALVHCCRDTGTTNGVSHTWGTAWALHGDLSGRDSLQVSTHLGVSIRPCLHGSGYGRLPSSATPCITTCLISSFQTPPSIISCAHLTKMTAQTHGLGNKKERALIYSSPPRLLEK